MARTAIFSVIFPANLIFFGDFINSLNDQDTNDFDLFLINDGVDDEILFPFLDRLRIFVEILKIDCTMTPIEIRSFGIKRLSEADKYDKVVFADTDDYMSSDRVSLSSKMLEKYPVVFNDFTLVNESKCIIENRVWKERLFSINDDINKEFILDKNVLGLGNTAMLTSKLLSIDIPKDIIAADWYLFSHFLDDNDKIGLIDNAVTFYRQHSSNIIGLKKVSLSRLLHVSNVKEKHYSAMSKYDKRYKELKVLQQEISRKITRINNTRLENIFNYYSNFFWWEETNYIKI